MSTQRERDDRDAAQIHESLRSLTGHDRRCEARPIGGLTELAGLDGPCRCAQRRADPPDVVHCTRCGGPISDSEGVRIERTEGREVTHQHAGICPPLPVTIEDALAWAAERLGRAFIENLDEFGQGALLTMARAARSGLVPGRGEVAVICGTGMKITSQVRHISGSYQMTAAPDEAYAAEIDAAIVAQGGAPPRRKRR